MPVENSAEVVKHLELSQIIYIELISFLSHLKAPDSSKAQNRREKESWGKPQLLGGRENGWEESGGKSHVGVLHKQISFHQTTIILGLGIFAGP